MSLFPPSQFQSSEATVSVGSPSDASSSSPPVTPGYVSAEEDHFSDATEGIGDEEAPATPVSTPLRSRLEADLEDDAPTPVNMSPRASKVPQIMELPMEVAGSVTEPMTPDTRRSSQEHGTYRVPIIPSSRNCTHEGAVETLVNEDYGIGAESIEVPSKQEQGQEEVGTRDATERTLAQTDNAFENKLAETTPDEFQDRRTGEEGVGFAFEFGDEFDDFGETVDGGDGFVDFEGFEEGTTANKFDTPEFTEVSQPVPAPAPAPAPAPTPQPQLAMPLLPVPVIDFENLNNQEEVQNTIYDIVSMLYSTDRTDPPTKPLRETSTGIFLTERSQALWKQLVARPPLQPPNWKRSRIRRLFLVSLGVPVDLDEILPASKQKKLILPSTKPVNKSLPSHIISPPPSPSRSSIDSSSGASKRNRSKSRPRTASSHRTSKVDKNPVMPDIDEPSARILCTTSDLVLNGMPEKELREHIRILQGLTSTASELLTWWLKKRDGAMGDKETFETVIESLVGYARKTRKGAL